MVAYNLVVNALAFSARGHRFDPRSRRENISVTLVLSLVSFAGMMLDKCAVLWIGTLTGSPLCRESHPMCRLKNPKVAFILQNRCVQCTPTHYPPGMILDKCAVLWIGTLTRGSLCRESHTLCRLKNPTLVYMITCRLSFCKTGMYNVRGSGWGLLIRE